MPPPEPKLPKLQVLPGVAVSAPLEARSEEELMLLCAAGRQDAFEVLVRRHLPRLTRFCAKLVGDQAQGEELSLEVMVSLWGMRERYRPDAPFPALLLTLARNRCRNHARSARRWLSLRAEPRRDEPPKEAPALEPSQLDALIERESERRVRAALQKLPWKLREALLLRFDQGLGYAELALIAGTNESTARSRVFHGIKKLQSELAGGEG